MAVATLNRGQQLRTAVSSHTFPGLLLQHVDEGSQWMRALSNDSQDVFRTGVLV